MVIHEDVINAIEQATLGEFDSITHLGFSNNGSQESASSDTLTGEFLRNSLSESDKDTTALTYEWNAVLGLTEGNGNTLQKFGLFTDASGNTLKLSKVLTETIAKTSDKEINVGFQISVEVTDESS